MRTAANKKISVKPPPLPVAVSVRHRGVASAVNGCQIIQSLKSSTPHPPEVPCEPQAFVVQAPKLRELSARKPRPLAKEDREAVVASRALQDEVIVIKGG